MEPTVVEAHDLGFVYPRPRRRALREVEFAVGKGSFTAILGPNGGGKSTLIKLILGMLKPTEGEVRVMDMRPGENRELTQRMIGYVPQQTQVNQRLPMHVNDVIGLAVASRHLQLDARATRERVGAALALVDLEGLGRTPFVALSGGQQQRVLLARALAVDPQVLVLDEPFAGVDAASQEDIVGLLSRVARDNQVTVLAVVHNINPLVHFVDHALLLNTRVVAFGPPEEVLTRELLTETYGASMEIVICEYGHRHPV